MSRSTAAGKVDTTNTYDGAELRSRLVAGWQVAHLYQGAAEPHVGVMVYSLDRKAWQVTDGMSDANVSGLRPQREIHLLHRQHQRRPDAGWLDMSSMGRGRHAKRLPRRPEQGPDPSPLAPESDEEKPKEPEKAETPRPAPGSPRPARRPGQSQGTPKEPEKVIIDLDDIDQRILALPIPAKNYIGLAREGRHRIPARGASIRHGHAGRVSANTLQKFDLSARKIDKFLDGVRWFDFSATGEKMLVSRGRGC